MKFLIQISLVSADTVLRMDAAQSRGHPDMGVALAPERLGTMRLGPTDVNVILWHRKTLKPTCGHISSEAVKGFLGYGLTNLTGISYAFALIHPDTFQLAKMNSYDDQLYPRVANLKLSNPALKVRHFPLELTLLKFFLDLYISGRLGRRWPNFLTDGLQRSESSSIY